VLAVLMHWSVSPMLPRAITIRLKLRFVMPCWNIASCCYFCWRR
jgi:hypothetical protein